jgi:hypothetical protein
MDSSTVAFFAPLQYGPVAVRAPGRTEPTRLRQGGFRLSFNSFRA